MKKRMRMAVAGACVAAGLAMWSAARAQEADTQPLMLGPSKATDRGTLVTVKADRIPLRAALGEVEDQAGLQVRYNDQQRVGDTLVTYAAEDKPALEVIKGLMDQVAGPGEAMWSLGEKGSVMRQVSGRVSVSGAFMVVAEEVSHVADYRQPAGQEERFVVKVSVIVDPAFRPVMYAEQCAAGLGGTAEDGGGHSLAPAGKVAEEATTDAIQDVFSDVWEGHTELVLRRPAEAGKKIAKLTGKLPVWVAQKTEVFDMREAGKQVKTIDGVKTTVTFGKDSTGSGWGISCTFDRPEGMSDEDWKQRSAVLSTTRMWVEGQDGKRWEASGGGSGSGTKQRTKSERFRVQGTGDPARAVIEVPEGAKRVEAAYSFTDLPLP